MPSLFRAEPSLLFQRTTMRGWSRSCTLIMATFLLRATSSRVVAKSFVSAFSVLPDTFLRTRSAISTSITPTPPSQAFRSFSSANYPSGGGAASKASPRMYTRRKVSGERLYRADRVLANRSGRTRSECFSLLQEKRVWQIDPTASTSNRTDEDPADTSSSIVGGKRKVLVMGPSAKISMHAPLWLDQTEEVALPPQLLNVYHKPVWVLSVRSDPKGRACLNGEEHLPNMHPVGRLDYDTSGLLLFSSSGPLTQTLLHPKHSVSKEYVAVVTGRVDEAALREQFTAGVVTGTGNHTADLVSVHHWETGEAVEGTADASSDENGDASATVSTATAHHSVTQFLADIKSQFPPEYNQTDLKVRGYLDVFDATELSTVTLTVTEGKHRMVRRMLANCGHAVVALTRERLGGISLGDLPVGTSRPLTAEENKWAEKQLGSQKKSSKPYRAKDKTSAVSATTTAKSTKPKTTKTRINKQ